MQEPSPKKIDGIAGRLSSRKVFSITYNVDRMYYELYLAVLKKNNVPVDSDDITMANKGRTEQHTIRVTGEEMGMYIGREKRKTIRYDGRNQLYIKLFNVDEEWKLVQKDWADHPEKWRDVWKKN